MAVGTQGDQRKPYALRCATGRGASGWMHATLPVSSIPLPGKQSHQVKTKPWSKARRLTSLGRGLSQLMERLRA